MNLKSMLENVAARYNEKTAVISGDKKISYAYLDKASDRLADSLVKLGAAKGERIAILASNSPENIIALLAIFKTGASTVPLDPQYRLTELTAILNDCQPMMLVSETSVLEPLVTSLPQFKSIKHIVNLDSGQKNRFLSYEELLVSGRDDKISRNPAPEDTGVILYTSGPSFAPRGAMLSHGALVNEATIMGNGFQQTDKDTVMMYALPLYHVFGLVAALLTALVKGSTIVMVPGTGLSIGSCMTAIEREKGTIFMGVPYIFALAVDLAEKEGIKHDLSSLRLVSSSADFLTEGISKRFKDLYGFNILNCFALTESICYVTCPPLDGSGKTGSVGKALPGWGIDVAGKNGTPVQAGQSGEIVVKGQYMSGYYNHPAETAETIKAGWLHTGDIGKKDEDGSLYILGRKKDIIIVKGQNIYPGDVELILRQCPHVEEASVFGIPDEMRGEVIGAAVRLKNGTSVSEPELRQWCSSRLANYKVPKQFFFRESLPHNSEGAVDKEDLRRQLSVRSTYIRVIS
jgi:long-chain acyl-CoA synthetase